MCITVTFNFICFNSMNALPYSGFNYRNEAQLHDPSDMSGYCYRITTHPTGQMEEGSKMFTKAQLRTGSGGKSLLFFLLL